MANNLTTLIKKLQMAINLTGRKLLYSTSQFYSEDQGRPITMYILHELKIDKKKRKEVKVQLFKTASQIQMLLYLKDMWEEIQNDNKDS